MKFHTLTAALLAAALITQPFAASASADIPVITPPCETTLYYSAGTVYVRLDESLSHGSAEIHRLLPEGDFLYYQYAWNTVDKALLVFPLIEGEYYLTLTLPADGSSGTEHATVPFSIADPDMDPAQSFDTSLLEMTIVCDAAAEDAVEASEEVLQDRVLTGDIAVTLARQPFALGDIGADGEINAVDAASILVESAVLGSGGETAFCDFQLLQADVNGDGSMNAEDAAVILTYAAECASGNFAGSLIEFQS